MTKIFIQLIRHFRKNAMAFLLVLAIILLGCNLSNKVADKFAGNWYTCSKDGLYLECFIKEKSFIFAASNGIITQHDDFSIIGDTLIYSDAYLYKDSLVIKKAIIHFASDSQFTLDYISPDEHWIFHKLKEDIPNIENHTQLLIDLQKRATKHQCIDKIQNDSVKKEIYFQF